MINVVNKSTLVSNTDTRLMTRACASQIKLHAAPAWSSLPIPVVYLSHEEDAAPGSWVIVLLDDADQQDALGYHDESPSGVIYGRVFVRPVLENGGDALSKNLSVASVLSHEVLETFGDPSCNRYADNGKGVAVALELGDPVENDSYVVKVSGIPVTVSNFVLPAWFDPSRKTGPYDYLGRLSSPFSMTRGGYMIEFREGKASPVYGEEFPVWRKDAKRTDLSRTSRRILGGSAS